MAATRPAPLPSLAVLRAERERLIAEVDPLFLAALTGGGNGPIPDPTRTLGWAQCHWIRLNCRMGEGDVYGEAPRLEAWQKLLFWKLAELEDNGGRRFQFAVLSLGKGSGKSPIGGWFGSVALAGPAQAKGWNHEGLPIPVRRRSPDVINMASSYEQADILLDEIRVTFEKGPMAKFATALQGLVTLKGIRGKARRIPATPKKADGSKATDLLVDEAHEFDSESRERAYNVASGGTAKRADGIVLILSTAGSDMTTLFGRIVARGLRGGFKRHELFVYMRASDDLDPRKWDDYRRDGRLDLIDAEILEGIRQANPLVAAGVVPAERLLTKFLDMPLYQAIRYYWNVWTSSNESWLPVGAWDGCKGELINDPSMPTWIGADMALTRDSAAVVAMQLRPDGRYQTWSRIWYPNGERVPQTECDDYIRGLCLTYNVQWIAADEAWWSTLGDLEKEGLPVFRMAQKGRYMIIAYSKTYRYILDRIILQDGSPDFADQIASAVPQSGDGGWVLKKGQHKKKIDSAPALAGAVYASTLAPPVVEPAIPRSEVF